jgi:tetratricopeptide (TPR) repeat protein
VSPDRAAVGPWRRRTASVAVCVALLAGYSLMGPRGLLPRPTYPDLPSPASVAEEEGALRARIDEGAWLAACKAADLPALPAPDGVEFTPAARLVEASRAWTRRGEGDALGRMADIYLALDRSEAALDLYVAARALGHQTARWAYFEGVVQQALGDAAAALEPLEAAARLDPEYGPTHARLGTALLELDRLEEADAAFARAAERQPAPALAWTGRARVALLRGEPLRALEFIERAVSLTPGDFQAHRLRALTLSALGRLDEARAASGLAGTLPTYVGWLSFDPRLVQVHRGSGTVRALRDQLSNALQRKDLTAAQAAAEEILAAMPRSADTLLVLATIHANRGDLQRARSLAFRAHELAPRSLIVLQARAEIAIAMSDAATMDQTLEELFTLDRSRADTWALLGRAHFVRLRYNDAFEALREAERLEPRNGSHSLLLAGMLDLAGEPEQASRVLSAALDRNPEQPEVRRALAQRQTR